MDLRTTYFVGFFFSRVTRRGNPGGGNPGRGNPVTLAGHIWLFILVGATLAGATASEGNLAGHWRGEPWRGLRRGRRGFLGPDLPPPGSRVRGLGFNPLLHCAQWLAGMHQVWQARSAAKQADLEAVALSCTGRRLAWAAYGLGFRV